MPPLKTSSAKAKGRSTQQYVRDTLYEILNLRDGDIESRGMGQAGVDIILSPHAREIYPFSLEVKHTRKFPSMQEIKQAKLNEIKGTLSGVVHQPHGAKKENSTITFNFKEFSKFWKEHRGGSKDTELAWAAGFFDGEGCTTIKKCKNEDYEYWYLTLEVLQTELALLTRFHKAVKEQGKIGGPWKSCIKGKSYKPRWTFRAFNEAAEDVMRLLWPYLSEPKKTQFELKKQEVEAWNRGKKE